MDDERNMSFLEHLGELRRRLIRILVVVLLAAAVCLLFARRALELLLLPYGSTLKVIGPTEGIAVYLRVAAIAGTALAMPWILAELWGFVAPALRPRERRSVLWLIPSATLLFLAGAAFAWFLMIPAAVRFLAGFGAGLLETAWTAASYVRFVTGLLFWIGACFELPLVLYFLARAGLVSPRSLLGGWRYAVVAILVVAALVTPTVDPVSMLLVSLPMVALYFLGVLVASVALRGRRERAEDREPG